LEEADGFAGGGATVSVRAIVLAAGKGTRMKSTRSKVLHELCGRSMLWYVLSALRGAGIDEILLVTNDELDPHAASFGVRSVIQREQLGTGHAVQIALEVLEPIAGGQIVVAYGDMPLIGEAIFREIVAALADERDAKPALALVTARMPLPSAFGRVVRNGKDVERIVEVRDASPAELVLHEMNAGIYAYDETALRDAVLHLRSDNAQGEYYLTDTVAHLVKSGKRVAPVTAPDHHDVLGINDRAELALARKVMNARICAQHMSDGVTIVDPDTTYLEPELRIGRDTILYQNTAISRLTEIGENCAIGPNVRLSGAILRDRVTVRESVILDSTLGSDVSVGPFAHLREHTILGDDVRIGNFVEVKNSQLAARAKASHLSYLGDAQIGERTNIGAGTITCNFDGRKKNTTKIGKDVQIGSNSSIVAPRTIGDGALTGAGSVVTKDVPPGERVAGNPARPLKKKK
jgi:bifunctional UDP-N-acetylglucosamine pyrophosphorylase/glucosamine-1-phosphate N-acetyltransferase